MLIQAEPTGIHNEIGLVPLRPIPPLSTLHSIGNPTRPTDPASISINTAFHTIFQIPRQAPAR